MTSICGKWVGRIQGSVTGGVFAELVQTKEGIYGSVQISDSVAGTVVYYVTSVQVNSRNVRLRLVPDKAAQTAGHGIVTVLAQIVSSTNLEGEWRSTNGYSGSIFVEKIELDLEQNDYMKSLTVEKDDFSPRRTKVFISYSHQDVYWLKRLRVHLRPLEQIYALDIWDDTKIKPGSKWIEEIDKAIQSAKVALLIVSADFLASDFIISNELPPLLNAAKKEGAVILPLVVSPSRFKSTKSLSQFQAVNDPSRPLINMTRGKQEDILVKISEEIENILVI